MTQPTTFEILEKVKDILGAREANYDNPAPNFQRTANLWNAYLKNRPIFDAPLEAWEIGIMQQLFKIAREQFEHKEDNLLDDIGYAVLTLRIREDK